MPPGMSNVSGSAPMSMASLYAMLGMAMPAGAAASGSVGSSPALAMISASNDSVAAEVATLVSGMTGATPPTGTTDLTTALLGLANLDPTVELQRLEAAVSSDAEMTELTNPNG